jgi:hypothetical protein
MVLIDSEVKYNIGSYGGAFYVNYFSRLSIINSEVSFNAAIAAGVIYIRGASSAQVDDSLLFKNLAVGYQVSFVFICGFIVIAVFPYIMIKIII